MNTSFYCYLFQDRLSRELESTQDKLSEANNKASDLERKVKLQADQLISLKEEMANLKTDHR